MEVTACKCEKIPEAEFDVHPELSEGWEVICRKGGYVYIGFRLDKDAPSDGSRHG